jgi:hypothetical protein
MAKAEKYRGEESGVGGEASEAEKRVGAVGGGSRGERCRPRTRWEEGTRRQGNDDDEEETTAPAECVVGRQSVYYGK